MPNEKMALCFLFFMLYDDIIFHIICSSCYCEDSIKFQTKVKTDASISGNAISL